MRALCWLTYSVWLVSLTPAYGELYKWVDQHGKIHLSDTLNGVPAEFRSQVEEMRGAPPVPRPALPVQPPTASKATRPAATPTSYMVPLVRLGNAMLVDVSMDGTVPARLLVDTGAEFTVISPAAAQMLALDLERAAVIPLRSASGVFLAPFTKVRSMAVGDATAYDVEVVVHEVASTLDGLLGMSFLDNFSVTLHSTDERLILTTLGDASDPALYGGHSKEWWIRKFRFYRRQLESMRTFLAANPSLQLQRTLQYFRAELDALDRQATLASVPRRWRD